MRLLKWLKLQFGLLSSAFDTVTFGLLLAVITVRHSAGLDQPPGLEVQYRLLDLRNRVHDERTVLDHGFADRLAREYQQLHSLRTRDDTH